MLPGIKRMKAEEEDDDEESGLNTKLLLARFVV